MRNRFVFIRTALALGALVACAADPITAPRLDPAGMGRPLANHDSSAARPIISSTSADGAAQIAATVLDAMGPVPTEATVTLSPFTPDAFQGTYLKYMQNFADSEPALRLTVDCCGIGGPYDNYYDRVSAYYVWWARAGGPLPGPGAPETANYLQHANDVLLKYRHWISTDLAWKVEPFDAQLDGLALHYLVTGDEVSRNAVGRLASRYASKDFFYFPDLSRTDRRTSNDNRVQARVLLSFVLADRIGAAPYQPESFVLPKASWRTLADSAFARILKAQSQDGSYKFESQCKQTYPFMLGMLNDAMIRYYDLPGTNKPAIESSVKRAVDYMWANNWVATAQAFQYLGPNRCQGTIGGPAPDLNLMVASGFGFVYQQTGNAAYRTNGDAVFTGGVNGAYIGGDKQFNQQFTSSYRYLGYRGR